MIRATSEGIPNSQTGIVEFDFSVARKHIRNGHADEIKLKDEDSMLFTLIKYDNEEFGKRMRAHTLAKFGLSEEVSE